MVRPSNASRHPASPCGWSERIIRSAAGNAHGTRYPRTEMLLEIGIVLLTIVCFVVLDLYVLGCEKV
jgi:hypothetical protein